MIAIQPGNLTREESRTGEGVRLEVVVDVDGDTGIVVFDVSGNGELGRVGTAAAGDGDLGARDVELGGRARVVDSDLLNTEEIVAAGEGRGDVGGV